MSEIRRLFRSRTERKIAGVCGGLATHFSLDPAVVRIAFILFAFLGGIGLLLYPICWFCISEEPREPEMGEPERGEGEKEEPGDPGIRKTGDRTTKGPDGPRHQYRKE